MDLRPAVLMLAAGSLCAGNARAQASYRNLDAGFPVRVEDATVTERYALDFDVLNFRYDELSNLRTRWQYEPQVAYGLLPRTEVWLRVPIFYRERTAAPRGGVAGIGMGAMYQIAIETQHVPALALASEIFKPTGPNALPASYSLKSLLTRSFAPGRVHLNASIASYSARKAPSLTVFCPPGSSSCGGGGTLPPLDGPCSIGSSAPFAPSFLCGAPAPLLATRATAGEIQSHSHWLVGAGIDKAFPLASTLVLADFFAEKFEGIGRKTDLTAEIGARHQLKPRVVIVGAIGRHFRGAGFSTFLTGGMTISHAFQL